MAQVTTHQQLTEIYGNALERALWKEIDHVNEHYRQFIEASPFCILATYGEKGVDCSPKGDPAGFVHVEDSKTLYLPDRRGNNRIDSLRNIIDNPSVGLIFFVPSVGETLRVSGQAEILLDPELCQRFAMAHKPAQTVLKIHVQKAYIQCQKAFARSGLWKQETYPRTRPVATAGQMAQHFAEQHGLELDGDSYDKNYPEHMKKTIY